MSWLASIFSFSRPSNTASSTPSGLESSASALPAPPSPKPDDPPATVDRAPSDSSPGYRPNRSKVIFGAGVVFFAFSLLITRRALARRRLATNPAFYANAPEHAAEQAKKTSGPMEAIEALNIATVNVLSLSMMAAGGTLWYLDINSTADARRVLRGGLGVDGTGRTEKDAEEDFEEWMATVLARKEAKGTRQPPVNERGQER